MSTRPILGPVVRPRLRAVPARPDATPPTLQEVVCVLLPAMLQAVPRLLAALLAWLPQSVYAVLVLAMLLFGEFATLGNAPVNPEALQTIGVIVTQCEAETFPNETPQCRTVRALATYCRTDWRARCTVRNFYRAVERLGFLLPPLRREASWQ